LVAALWWPLLAQAAITGGAAEGGARRGEVFRVVLDPGHGGEREGAVGPAGTREKDLALKIARRVAELCRRRLGAQALLTRTGDTDVPLRDRVAFANHKRADLFLSIHANAAPSGRRSAVGVETYFLSADPSGASAAALVERENSDEEPNGRGRRGPDDVSLILDDLTLTSAQANASRLAYAIHQKLVLRTGAPDRGVQQAPFFVLTGARMPAVLLEIGFLTNPDEEQLLVQPAYQKRLAEAVVEGIAQYRSAGASDGGEGTKP
jgi:N-acetylmuramoyl-L-alanine amidase